MNTLTINGYNAVVAYDEEIDMFRGEFIGLNGGADFYASDIAGVVLVVSVPAHRPIKPIYVKQFVMLIEQVKGKKHEY
jgi:hypothetical protein